MERFWRGAGVALGKYWIVVMGAVVLITVVIAPGLG